MFSCISIKIFNTLAIVTLNFLSGSSNILAYLSSVIMIVLLFLSMFLKMATHSSIHAWKIPWTKEPGGLQSMGLQRVRHD